MRQLRVNALNLALVLGMASSVHAAEWQISSTRAEIGGEAMIEVSLRGDGESITAELEFVYDSARLELPVASGVIPGGGGRVG